MKDGFVQSNGFTTESSPFLIPIIIFCKFLIKRSWLINLRCSGYFWTVVLSRTMTKIYSDLVLSDLKKVSCLLHFIYFKKIKLLGTNNKPRRFVYQLSVCFAVFLGVSR